MQLKQLQYFLKLYELGSFSKVAKEMFVTEQALSKSLRSLEEEFGVTLFVRGNGVLKATEQGDFVYAKLRPTYDALVLSSANVFETFRREKEENLTVSLPIGAQGVLPLSLLLDFSDEYPEVNVDQVQLNSSECFEALTNHQVNVAAMMYDPSDELCFIDPVDDRLAFLVSDDDPLAAPESVDFSRFDGRRILMRRWLFTDDDIAAKCAAHGAAAEIIIADGEDEQLIDLVISRKLIYLSSEKTLAGRRGQRGVKVVPLTDETYKLGFAVLRSDMRTGATRKFVEFLRGRMG